MKNSKFRKIAMAIAIFFCGFMTAMAMVSPEEEENRLAAELDDMSIMELEMRLENLEFRIEATGLRISVPKLEALVEARNQVANKLEMARAYEDMTSSKDLKVSWNLK